MKTIKYTAMINGVESVMLFTPRLFEFKTESMDFSSSGTSSKVNSMYADLAYCAALNYWTLLDKNISDFPLTRVDFHEWSALCPTEFGKMVRIAVEAITNKSIEELLQNQTSKQSNEEVKKKTSTSIIPLLRRFWLAIVG